MSDLTNFVFKPGDQIAVDVAVEVYLNELIHVRKLKKSSILRYTPVLRHFSNVCAVWGFTTINDVPREVVLDVVSDDRYRAKWSKDKAITVIRAFLRYYELQGFISKNVAQTIRVPKGMPARPAIPFSDADLRAIASHLKGKNLLLFDLMRRTGLRISDAVNFSADKLVGNYKIFLRAEKNNQPITMPISQDLYGRLMRLFAENQHGFLGKGNPPYEIEFYRRKLKEAFALAGLPRATPHNLRHTFASRVAAHPNGGIHMVCTLLGISRKVAEQNYIRYTSDMDERIRKVIEEV